MTFIVLEGFSGTGKTTLAVELEGMGWLRLAESAHAVPRDVPLAERADTFADYSLFGATLVNSSTISKLRGKRKLVSEGYLLSDLAYAKIRQDLGTSSAYPAMLEACRAILREASLRPDLYVQLEASEGTLDERQRGKSERDRNPDGFFRARYYTALAEIHEALGEKKVVKVRSDSDPSATLQRVLAVLRENEVPGA